MFNYDGTSWIVSYKSNFNALGFVLFIQRALIDGQAIDDLVEV